MALEMDKPEDMMEVECQNINSLACGMIRFCLAKDQKWLVTCGRG